MSMQVSCSELGISVIPRSIPLSQSLFGSVAPSGFNLKDPVSPLHVRVITTHTYSLQINKLLISINS